VRRGDGAGSAESGVFAAARLIGPRATRRLFVRFCREVRRFSGRFEVEISPFEVSLRDPGADFCVVVSPLRDLFLVSIGENRSFDVRVSSSESFVSALDLALERYLVSASRAPAAAR
jgi:hypothetical protein